MPRLRLLFRSGVLVVLGVLVAALTDNPWLGVGLAVAGVAAVTYAVQHTREPGSDAAGTQQQKLVKAALVAALFLGFVVAVLSLVLQPT